MVIARHSTAVKHIGIDLNDPFKKTCEAVLALPNGRYGGTAQEELVAEALRYLYNAAHGSTMETSIGRITIMPATDPYLVHESLSLVTRSDLLSVAERRTAFVLRAGRNGASIHLER